MINRLIIMNILGALLLGYIATKSIDANAQNKHTNGTAVIPTSPHTGYVMINNKPQPVTILGPNAVFDQKGNPVPNSVVISSIHNKKPTPTLHLMEEQRQNSTSHKLEMALNDYQQKRYPQAIDHARSVIDRDPKNIDAMKILGASYALQGNTSEARQWFVRVQKSDPKDKNARAWLSRLK